MGMDVSNKNGGKMKEMKYKWMALDVYGYRLYRVYSTFNDGINRPYTIESLVLARTPNMAKKMVEKKNEGADIQSFKARAERILMRNDFYDEVWEMEEK